MQKIDVKFKNLPDNKVQIAFSDTKKTVTIDLSGLRLTEKIAHIRARILAEGYFYSHKIEKKVIKFVANS